MQYKTKLVFLLLIGNFIFSDSIKYNNPNNHGVVGLINTPTARFYDESSAAFTAYRGDPDRKITLTLMPYDWFEASVFYTSIKGLPYGNGFNQDYKDKGFNTKFRIKKEGKLPAIAIGFNDIAGTGLYSSEYIVGSYGINNLDISLGIGWGRLSGGRFKYDNLFGDIDESFLIRDSETDQGGKLNTNNYFSGKDMAFFGGVSYLIDKDWLFKLEYDSTDIPLSFGFPERSASYNLSFEYIGNDNFALALNYEREDYIGLKFIWKGNSSEYNSKPFKNNQPYETTPHGKLRSLLDFNGIQVQKISTSGDYLILDVDEYNSYSSLSSIESNLENSMDNSNINYEEVIVSYSINSLKAKTIESSNFADIDSNNIEILYAREKDSTFSYSPNFVLRPFIAGREDFLKVALMAEFNTQYIFKNKLFWSTNLKYALWQNFDDLYIPPIDTYPNQVRSDVKDYLNNFQDRLILGRSQLDFFHSFSENNHIQVSAGIFEEMFSGYGIEYLWNKNDLPFAIGFEAFEVYKRDYDLAFGLLDYSNITGHVNFYYENNYILPFSLQISYGEYLAGDKGYTFDLSRRFNNGVIMGGFFSKTDVTAEQFGEGSFDKGIYFKIPIYGDWFNSLWRPLTKDPGAKLIRKNNLYDFLRKYKY
ncbi:MAG: hypothetical protein CMG62_06265 [Candidatus Marinimicrobia bacterium]|nr:hypothetical protein [Candidatus Neomarinimicrobiota bacterium]|tara:strand:- start:6440 stop:8377 length:1938 start_codon:yes stop_codon:yes gene_type:complete